MNYEEKILIWKSKLLSEDVLSEDICNSLTKKIVKKIININYKNYTLYKDQELNPFETTFTQNDIRKLFPEFEVSCGYPSWAVSIRSLFNYQNGGLVLYILRRKFND